MIEAVQLAEKVWLFKDAIDRPKEFFSSISGWVPVGNQSYMETAIVPTKQFLEDTDEAIMKCLDIYYLNNQHLNDLNYKLTQFTHYYRRGAGEGYGDHTDFARLPDDTFSPVQATILGYYSDPDEYEGGEIFFSDYDVSIKPEAGSIIIFGDKVLHGVAEVTGGTRTLSSVFLLKNRTWEKQTGINLSTLTKEDERWIRENSPQYERKNGVWNINVSEPIEKLEG
jgi:hypothetical protein